MVVNRQNIMVDITEAIKSDLNFNGISELNSKGEKNYNIRIRETTNFYLVKVVFYCRNTNKRINTAINSLVNYFDVPQFYPSMTMEEENYVIRDKKYCSNWGVDLKLMKP